MVQEDKSGLLQQIIQIDTIPMGMPRKKFAHLPLDKRFKPDEVFGFL